MKRYLSFDYLKILINLISVEKIKRFLCTYYINIKLKQNKMKIKYFVKIYLKKISNFY